MRSLSNGPPAAPRKLAGHPLKERMRRAEIRLAVDLALAENGYSRGYYRWYGPDLRIYDRHGNSKSLYFPAGRTSRKRLIEKLSTLPVAGPPRAYIGRNADAREYRQIDIEEYTRA
jgi:hypothetical protein